MSLRVRQRRPRWFSLCQHGEVEDKNAWRQRIRAHRRALSAQQREVAAHALSRVALAEPVLAGARSVVAYAALPTEPDPGPLVDALLSRGTRVGLPCVAVAGLTFARYTGTWRQGAPVPGGLRIPEPTGRAMDPTECDVVLVPALAVDRSGVRLGQGGGYYDRTRLTAGPGRPPVVAVVFDDEFVPGPLPAQSHDLRVDAVLTPGEWTWLSARGLGSSHA